MGDFLYPYQREAISRMKNGCILNGGVGSGKSRTGLYYYFKEQGGSIVNGNYKRMKKPKDLYIITTARKRDTLEWEIELAPYQISKIPGEGLYKNQIIIDSWNNIKKYKKLTGAFFIFDEQRAIGSGSWSKAFIEIAKHNDWILLSATPGDVWSDYIPVFIANGFYKNRKDFEEQHIVWKPFTKYKQILRYYNTGRLIRLRNSILVSMDYERHVIKHKIFVDCSYDKIIYNDIRKNRWNPYTSKPIKNINELCLTWRKLVNTDPSRWFALLELLKEHDRAIIFYNYDYELDILRNLKNVPGLKVAEWNGHIHQEIPQSLRWVYLVQYNAGAEGWNCTSTDTMIFYSQNYSYKSMEQASGRIDRLTTPFSDLYYYHMRSKSPIDIAIGNALAKKKQFNEKRYLKGFEFND